MVSAPRLPDAPPPRAPSPPAPARNAEQQTWKTRLKAQWKTFAADEPGRRFRAQYERHQAASAGRSWAVRMVYPLAALVSFAIGVVLAFIPGPAFVFFGLSGALLSMQSRAIAKLLDRGELKARQLRNRFKAWRSARRSAAAS